MAKIKFIAFDGVETEIEAENGLSLMQAAVNNGVAAIVAECGGACSCATCHVHIDKDWFDKMPAAQDMEKEMLDFVMNPKETSRLSCQIKIDDSLDGLLVHTPESQY